jgi:hypothetical protein
MLLNKWISLALNLAILVITFLATVNWADYLPTQAGTIVIVLAAVKAVLNVLQPPPSQTVVPTGNAIVTHT